MLGSHTYLCVCSTWRRPRCRRRHVAPRVVVIPAPPLPIGSTLTLSLTLFFFFAALETETRNDNNDNNTTDNINTKRSTDEHFSTYEVHRFWGNVACDRGS